MKILRNVIMILLFVVLANVSFADEDEPGTQKEAYDGCLKAFKSLYTQRETKDGKDGVSVTCIMSPAKEAVALAWEIRNPNNILINVKPSDIRFYNGEETGMLDPAQAVSAIYGWDQTELDLKDTAEEFKTLNTPYDVEVTEDFMYKSIFPFGESADDLIYGITYFGCRLKGIKTINAEIKLGDEVFKFTFDGGGP